MNLFDAELASALRKIPAVSFKHFVNGEHGEIGGDVAARLLREGFAVTPFTLLDAHTNEKSRWRLPTDADIALAIREESR